MFKKQQYALPLQYDYRRTSHESIKLYKPVEKIGRCFMHVPERIFAFSTRKKGKERKREEREKRKRKGEEIVIF